MAKDDMHLIIYKILRYLYDCNKKGKTPTFSDMFAALELSTMPQSYLAQILMELIDGGYISGCSVIVSKDGIQFNFSDSTMATLSGVDYLAENSRMRKAADVAGRAFEILLDGIISAAMPK